MTSEGKILVEGNFIAANDSMFSGPKSEISDIRCSSCEGTLVPQNKRFQFYVNKLKVLSGNISSPNLAFNQNFVTPETAVRRILYAHHRDNLSGKKVYFIGDDDLTSMALGIAVRDADAVVLDVDNDLLISLQDNSNKLPFSKYRTIHFDANNPLMESEIGKADLVFMDPTSTVLQSFIDKALLLLKPKGVIYTFYNPEYKGDDTSLQRIANENGLHITDIIPRFNQYSSFGRSKRLVDLYQDSSIAFTESLYRLVKKCE